MFSGMGWGHDPRKWRKIGVYCEDLWGIPACKAEIGNWTVVIIGCGIDVVPINQNCWINKKMLKVSLPWRCPKNVRTPSPTIAHYGPIPTAMICRSSSWLRSTCLCLFLYLFISVSVCVCLSHKQRSFLSIYPCCFFHQSIYHSFYPSIAHSIHHLSLEWSTFTHLKQCPLQNTWV